MSTLSNARRVKNLLNKGEGRGFKYLRQQTDLADLTYKEISNALKNQYEDYKAQWKKLNPESLMLCDARTRARKRNIFFDLKKEDIKIPIRCPILGTFLTPKGEGSMDESPSLDRIDSKKGYTKDNVQVISNRANRLKADGNIEEFRLILKWLTENET